MAERAKHAHAGQKPALGRATVASEPCHRTPVQLGPPKHTSRHASASASCQRASHLLPRPPLALWRVPERRPRPPVAARILGLPRARSSLPLSFPGRRPRPGTTTTRSQALPRPSAKVTTSPAHGPAVLLAPLLFKATPSPLSTPLALSPSRAPLDQPTPPPCLPFTAMAGAPPSGST